MPMLPCGCTTGSSRPKEEKQTQTPPPTPLPVAALHRNPPSFSVYSLSLSLSLSRRPIVCLRSPPPPFPSISITALCADLSQTPRGPTCLFAEREIEGWGGKVIIMIIPQMFARQLLYRWETRDIYQNEFRTLAWHLSTQWRCKLNLIKNGWDLQWSLKSNN